MPRILIADDDNELCELLREYLISEDFEVAIANDGQTALTSIEQGDHDLVVLDVMMPRKNGFDVLRELRTRTQIPVLMLTARGEDVDSVIGLELGADDYLAKPCSPRVLVAHVRSILRRSGNGAVVSNPDVLHVDDLSMHTGARLVTRHGERIDMTSTEYSVLETLLRAAGRVVSKADLSEHALGRKLARFDRSLDMHVSNLRKKLGVAPNGDERIKTVRGVGYQYVSP